MIEYIGNKMLMPGYLKEYITDKQRILDFISAKKELFVVTLKGGIPEEQWNKFFNNVTIIRSIEISSPLHTDSIKKHHDKGTSTKTNGNNFPLSKKMKLLLFHFKLQHDYITLLNPILISVDLMLFKNTTIKPATMIVVHEINIPFTC
jgi:hypothetical protein